MLKNDHSYELAQNSLRLRSPEERRRIDDLIFLFKFINKKKWTVLIHTISNIKYNDLI